MPRRRTKFKTMFQITMGAPHRRTTIPNFKKIVSGYDWIVINRFHVNFRLPVNTATGADCFLPSGCQNNMMKFIFPFNCYKNIILPSGEFNKRHDVIKDLQQNTLNIGVKPCGPRARTVRGPKGGTSTPSNTQIGGTMCPTIFDMIR